MASKNSLIQVGSEERDDEYDSDDYTEQFELKGCNEISQIFISGGRLGISAIQFQYVENGEYVLSEKYGHGSHTSKFHTIELNHPAEYITGVSGLYYGTNAPIRVINFTTNIKEYGPFGLTDQASHLFGTPKPFTFNLGKSCQFGGFHGMYNSSGLISIGLYLSVKTTTPTALPRRLKNEA